MPGRFAIDIETVSPSLDRYERVPDFRDSQYFELLAVVLGYEASDGKREAEMLFREAQGPDGELDLVTRTCDWIEARAGETFLTYGGTSFDVPHLLGRARAAAAESPGRADAVRRLEELLETNLEHVDVQPPVWEAFGEYTRLEEACEAVGIDTEDTRWADFEHGIDLDELRPAKYRGDETVVNRDIPVFGERYLALADVDATETVTFRALRDLLDHYGREDVAHLFELADARPFDGSA